MGAGDRSPVCLAIVFAEPLLAADGTGLGRGAVLSAPNALPILYLASRDFTTLRRHAHSSGCSRLSVMQPTRNPGDAPAYAAGAASPGTGRPVSGIHARRPDRRDARVQPARARPGDGGVPRQHRRAAAVAARDWPTPIRRPRSTASRSTTRPRARSPGPPSWPMRPDASARACARWRGDPRRPAARASARLPARSQPARPRARG